MIYLIILTTFIGMMGSLIWFPRLRYFNITFQPFWVFATIGALLIVFFQLGSLEMVWVAWFQGHGMSPIRILGLFFSFTILAIYLDEVGFIKYVAYQAVQRAGSSQKKLFFIWFVVNAIATILTANDIVVLTLTPFIIYLARHAKISPIPYLISQFVSANTWSMLLIIGNPTNIYLATSFQIDFLAYVEVMVLPTMMTGVISYAILSVFFHRELTSPISNSTMVIAPPHASYRIGLIMLALAIGLMIMNDWLGISMDETTILISIFMIIWIYIRYPKTVHLSATLKRLPFSIVPFFLSMTIIIQSLQVIGWTDAFRVWLGNGSEIYRYGIGSFFMSNLMNNIPMSVWFTTIINGMPNPTIETVYAAIIGSNIGAIFTPVGSLAGLMWMGILKNKQVDFSFSKFMNYGLIIGPALLMVSLFVLDMISR